jgi:hypothetical protein
MIPRAVSATQLSGCGDGADGVVLIGIESRELKLLELVQSLGEYLTDDDVTVRAKGSFRRRC